MSTDNSSTAEYDSPMLRASGDDDAHSHHGSLRSKLVLSLAGIFLVFLTIDEAVRRRLIEPEFVALEHADAIRDANRVLATMNAEVEHLTELARHWALQIDLGRMPGTATGQTTLNLRGPWTTKKKLDWAATIAEDGTWHWHSTHASHQQHPPQVIQQLRSLVDACHQSGRASLSGMTRIGDQSLVMFAVVTLDNQQPKAQGDSIGRGFLIVARDVDEGMVMSLRSQTQVEFSLQSPRTSDESKKLVVWAADPSMLVVEVQLTGIDDQKLANVYIEVPRDITARSQRTNNLARNSFIFGSVAALLLLLLLLQRIVIGPLTAIREHSNRIAEEGLATEPLVLTGNDEIGQLARTLDNMVNRLSETQDKLTLASQAAGRSQVASNVIHNVGNVLTNVNSLLDAASDRASGLRITPLTKLADRLKESDPDSGLLAATPDYLEGLAGSLKSDQQSISELLATLDDNIRHIHDVIRAQKQHTDKNVTTAPVNLKNIIDEAIACCRARLEKDAVGVTISGSLSVKVDADRSLLLQTMINIIANARHAMRDNGDQSRMLGIDVHLGSSKARICFRDNGCGMDGPTLQKVFDAHFTTRENGTGLGLHFCANTLKRLGGSITAESEGPGKGSTFAIELPLSGANSTESGTSADVPAVSGRANS